MVTILSKFYTAKVSRRCNGAFRRYSVLVVQLPKFLKCALPPKCSITCSWNFGSVKFRQKCYHLWRFQKHVMEHLAIISHYSFRSIGFHKSRSPSSPYGPAPQGSQLITMYVTTYLPDPECHANQPGWPILNWTGWNKVGTQQRHQVKQFWVFFVCVNGAKTGSLTTKVAKKRPK